MTSKAVSEFRSPEAELQTAFNSLDANSDGVVSRDELFSAIESVVATMPPDPAAQVAGRNWADESAAAFDAIDVDGNGLLDYEEFVAMLSGLRVAPSALEEVS